MFATEALSNGRNMQKLQITTKTFMNVYTKVYLLKMEHKKLSFFRSLIIILTGCR